MTVRGVNADGSTISQSAMLTYDGKDVAFTGSTIWDTLSLKKVNGSRQRPSVPQAALPARHWLPQASAGG